MDILEISMDILAKFFSTYFFGTFFTTTGFVLVGVSATVTHCVVSSSSSLVDFSGWALEGVLQLRITLL